MLSVTRLLVGKLADAKHVFCYNSCIYGTTSFWTRLILDFDLSWNGKLQADTTDTTPSFAFRSVTPLGYGSPSPQSPRQQPMLQQEWRLVSRTLGTKTYFLDQETSMLYGACEVSRQARGRSIRRASAGAHAHIMPPAAAGDQSHHCSKLTRATDRVELQLVSDYTLRWACLRVYVRTLIWIVTLPVP
jgi:hypothetical protein